MNKIVTVIGMALVCSILTLPVWAIDISLPGPAARDGSSSFLNPYPALATVSTTVAPKILHEDKIVLEAFIRKSSETRLARDVTRENVDMYASPPPAGLDECISECNIARHRKQGMKSLLNAAE